MFGPFILKWFGRPMDCPGSPVKVGGPLTVDPECIGLGCPGGPRNAGEPLTVGPEGKGLLLTGPLGWVENGILGWFNTGGLDIGCGP